MNVPQTEQNSQEIISNEKQPKVLLDTNVLLAYHNTKSPFHFGAKTAIEAMIAKDFVFLIPHMVMGEFITHRKLLGEKKCSVPKAIKILYQIFKKLKKHLHGGSQLNTTTILTRLKEYSRKQKLTQEHFTDFLIITEVAKMPNIRVVTCDYEMSQIGKSIFNKRIYYLSTKTSKKKNGLCRLIKEIQKI